MDPYNSLKDFMIMVGYENYVVCENEPIKKKSIFGNKKPELAPLPLAVPAACSRGGGIECHPTVCDCWNIPQGPTLGDILGVKQEGKTPMRYNETSSYAAVNAPESDIAVQRKYLLDQLRNAKSAKRNELQKVFNLYVDNTPKTYADMIAIIKAGTYTIDQKIAAYITANAGEDFAPHSGPLHGIIWPGPVADYDGFNAAEKDAAKQGNTAERAIMTGDAAAGLAALQAFEAWLPTPAATPAPTAVA